MAGAAPIELSALVTGGIAWAERLAHAGPLLVAERPTMGEEGADGGFEARRPPGPERPMASGVAGAGPERLATMGEEGAGPERPPTMGAEGAGPERPPVTCRAGTAAPECPMSSGPWGALSEERGGGIDRREARGTGAAAAAATAGGRASGASSSGFSHSACWGFFCAARSAAINSVHERKR